MFCPAVGRCEVKQYLVETTETVVRGEHGGERLGGGGGSPAPLLRLRPVGGGDVERDDTVAGSGDLGERPGEQLPPGDVPPDRHQQRPPAAPAASPRWRAQHLERPVLHTAGAGWRTTRTRALFPDSPLSFTCRRISLTTPFALVRVSWREKENGGCVICGRAVAIAVASKLAARATTVFKMRRALRCLTRKKKTGDSARL